ncbi:MAG TPA: polysaccharide lyase family protein [Acidobacteriaceae bacterium]|nr:polysaccharide lyase family protein [Acidobacteriaceae bacterium]
MLFRYLLAALLLAVSPLPSFAQSSPRTIWNIGKFDGSSGEFASGQPHAPVVFTVGKDHPQADWYAYAHSAFAGKPSNPKTAPRAIDFSIAGRPSRNYRLTVSLIIEHSSVPALRIGINGRIGLFYLHPKLDYAMGDMMAAFYPAYSRAEVECDFPGSWLKNGHNQITLQAVATHKEGVPDAGMNYDAIGLQSTASVPAAIEVRVQPTIFFTKNDTGLDERVDVFVRYRQHPHSGSVALKIAGHTLTHPLQGGQDFGEERLSFAVPQFPADTPAHLTVKLNGHRTRLTEVLNPRKKWTLFMVPHVHLDVGYTDYQAKVSAIQSRILDEAMDLTAKHPAFRFSTDGEWNLEQFLASRSPQEKQRIITAIRKKQLYIPAQSSNLLTGFPTAETLIRSLYPSADFSRKYGIPYNYANITDVPSYSWSYASILAAAHIKYFLAGSNNDRAPVLLLGHLNENSPFWWQGPDGGKVLMWYSRHYMQMQFIFGLPPLTATGKEILPVFLEMYEHPSYHANAAIIFGTQVENTDLYPQQATLAGKWNALYAYPRIEYSGFHDALANIAHKFGSDIPTVRGDGGPYWEDGIGSDALYAAMERENESRAPSAEKLATISTLVNPRLAVNHKKLNSMWANMVLMDEHTWTSWNSVSDPTSKEAIQQLRVKDSRAITAAALRENILRTSMATLSDSIAAGRNSLIVFNPLNWARDGEVTINLDKGMEIADHSTGKAVPYLVLSVGPNFRKVEFTAKHVPAVGYKVYELRTANSPAAKPQTTTTTTLESPYYRVVLDPSTGSIQSIYDKQLKREIVDTDSKWRFGQYLYVSGGDKAPNSILQYRAISPKPVLHVHPSEHGRLISVEQTPWGWRAQLESSADNTPTIHTEIRLFNNQKKIELIENIDKKPELKKEAVYFAFPFAMKHPQFQYEIQNGVVDPVRDMYPGAGREWFSVQHWVSVQQDGVSATVMPLDASLVTLGDINRGAWPTKFGQRPGTIFSYVMNNYWHTNYRAEQGGHFRFRYIITSAAHTNAPALSRTGWEEATPLEEDQITSQDKALDLPRPLDGNQGSFLSVNDPDLLLDTWKPAEDGRGTILRLIDLGGAARTVTISTPLLDIDHVSLTDAVERDIRPITPDNPHAFKVSVLPHAIVTVRIIGKPLLHAPTE